MIPSSSKSLSYTGFVNFDKSFFLFSAQLRSGDSAAGAGAEGSGGGDGEGGGGPALV